MDRNIFDIPEPGITPSVIIAQKYWHINEKIQNFHILFTGKMLLFFQGTFILNWYAVNAVIAVTQNAYDRNCNV